MGQERDRDRFSWDLSRGRDSVYPVIYDLLADLLRLGRRLVGEYTNKACMLFFSSYFRMAYITENEDAGSGPDVLNRRY